MLMIMMVAMNLESKDVVAGDLLARLGEGRPISWLNTKIEKVPSKLKENLRKIIN